jgi:hypothetical protein
VFGVRYSVFEFLNIKQGILNTEFRTNARAQGVLV